MKDLLLKINILLNFENKLKLFNITIIGLFVSILEMIGIGIVPIYLGFILEPESIFNFPFLRDLGSLLRPISSTNLIILVSLTLIIFFVFKNIIIFYLNLLQANFFKNLNIFNSKKLFEFYIKSPILNIKNINSAIAQRNITGETVRASRFIEALISILREAFIIISLLTLLLFVDFKSTLIVFILLGGFSLIFQNLIKSKIINKSRKAQQESGQINKIIFHALGAIKTTKILNKEYHFINNFNSSIAHVENLNFWVSLWGKLPKLVLEIFAIVSIVSIVIFLVYYNNVNNLNESLGFLILLGAAFVKLFPSISAINSFSTTLRSSKISFNLIIDEFQKYNKISNKKNYEQNLDYSNNKINFKKQLTLENIFFKYPDSENYILNDVSLNINSNSIVGIFGRSGAGKSTLLDIITSLIKPTKGKIFVDGEMINDTRSWQKNIGYITQDTYLLDQSIKNNIAFGEKDKDIKMDRIKKAISLSQLKEFVDMLPNGLETIIGEKGSKISGGQIQRIAMARSLYRDNGLIILDESTNSLDQTTERNFLDDLVKLKKICTIIIVSHKINTLKICDKVYEIKNSKIFLNN